MTKQMNLNVFLSGLGHHESAWRLPHVNPGSNVDVEYYQRLAQIAERGKLDSVFFADIPSIGLHPARRPVERLDPLLLLSAMAVATDRIGLIATASTTFESPFSLARRFASLDVISGGRAGWNVVTTSMKDAAANFGLDAMPEPAERYRRAHEFVDVAKGLWLGWEDDAVVVDKAAGVFADPARIHSLDHVGEHFCVKGPLNVGRSAQGHPVVVQAGSSDDGIGLAAAHGEAVFTAQRTVEEGQAFYRKLKAATAAAGRNPEHIKILPGIVPILGSTESEARELERQLDEFVVLDFGLDQLSGDIGIPVEEIDLDAPLPSNIREVEPGTNSRYELTVALARRENLTVRELLLKLGAGRGHNNVVGSPEQIADILEDWFRQGACDGFNVMPADMISGLSIFVDHVVPILQQRGLFRREYTGSTLREHYGLPVPQSATGAAVAV